MTRERVAEHIMRPRLFGPRVRLRVDLHGVAIFGQHNRRTLIRWEAITAIEASRGVVIRSREEQVTLPPRAFRVPSAELARLLEEARSIQRRAEVIGRLATR